MKVEEIIKKIENFAPLCYQEDYDNSGVQVGDVHTACSGVLLTLDITEEVVEEAIQKKCNLIVAHHPLIFSGLKKITGKNYVERSVIKAIQNQIVVYAAHTNLDNMRFGVNHKIAQKLGLINTQVLNPMSKIVYKLIVFVPVNYLKDLREALFAAGAGNSLSYVECSFSSSGTGTFRPLAESNPVIGKAGGERESVEEVQLEVLVPEAQKNSVLTAMKQAHPYEVVAYDLVRLENKWEDLGAGIVGEFPVAMDAKEALELVKERMNASMLRHTSLGMEKVSKVAVCGGSGSFLLAQAKAAGADLFVTADYKYHQFFDAEDKIIIADIGHYESEHHTIELFEEILEEFTNSVSILRSETNTNPVKYL